MTKEKSTKKSRGKEKLSQREYNANYYAKKIKARILKGMMKTHHCKVCDSDVRRCNKNKHERTRKHQWHVSRSKELTVEQLVKQALKKKLKKISFGLRLKILRSVVDLHAIFGALRVKMFLFDTLVDVEEKCQDRRD
jgi:hypothetical protein